LNDREQEALASIELQLWLEDPGLARTMARRRTRLGERLAYDLVTGLSVAAGMFCLALSESGGMHGGLTAVLFASATFAVRVWRFGPP
jgi:hypothetical protein